MKQVLINNSIFFDQVAILKDGKLEDFFHEEKDAKSLVGNIYKGRVMNILPGMEAAFVDVGLDKNAYLFLDDLLSDKFLKEKNIRKKDAKNISKILKKGDEILVQIAREPIGEKNVAVTTDISISGKYIALIPKSIEVNISKKVKDAEERKRLVAIGKEIMENGNGMIIRTYAQDCTKDAIEKEYRILSSVYEQIEQEFGYSYAPKLMYKSNSLVEKVFMDSIDSSVDEIYVEDKNTKEKLSSMINMCGDELRNIKIVESERSFQEFEVEKQIQTLFERKVELQNGGSIFIDVTEALTVIDVNSGKYVGSENMEETALQLNLAAMEEIARQIRLRNISGIILIDFIDVKSKDNIELIISRAKSAFRDDKAKTNVLGMTKLNLMEITRKKNKENFYNLITQQCSHCSGSGRTASKIYIFLRLESIIKNIRKNTTSEAVVLKSGYIMNSFIQNNCMDIIKKIQQKYSIKIFFRVDENVLTDEIAVEKTGNTEYINSYLNSKIS
ncbi:MAG: Rne/Rng family ribonuclease [Sedimentibacter sp.]|uniref:Rne/Rng family ribonuclease n=1 Tax=Sedimentibacter sp. TaxID=1960295 RepID=UPI0031590037